MMRDEGASLDFRDSGCTLTRESNGGAMTTLFPERCQFAPQDWIKHYPDLFGTHVKLPEFPWDSKVINEECPFTPGKPIRETHFAFLGVRGLTIRKIIESLSPDSQQLKLNYGSTMDTVVLKGRWYLFFIGAVPGSINCSIENQKKLLPKAYEIPQYVAGFTARLLLHTKGISLNTPYLRCRGYMTKFGQYPRVGPFSQEMNHPFLADCDGKACPTTGLFASLKVP